MKGLGEYITSQVVYVHYIDEHFIRLVVNVYDIEKHVIHLGYQSVLNRKACYTPSIQRPYTHV